MNKVILFWGILKVDFDPISNIINAHAVVIIGVDIKNGEETSYLIVDPWDGKERIVDPSEFYSKAIEILDVKK